MSNGTRCKPGSLFVIVALLVAVAVLAGPLDAQELKTCRTWTTCTDFDEGEYNNVICTSDGGDDDGHLELVRDPARAGYAWIPYVCMGIISKIDIREGREVARYRISPAGAGYPRTAVDSDGNCYVALFPSACQGKVVKILNDGGVDRNSNGIIETSTGPNDLYPYGQDERVVWDVPVGLPSQIPGAIAIDLNGDIWVGLKNTLQRRYVILDPDTGAEKYPPVPVTRDPFGAIVDSNGFLWSAVEQFGMEKIDTVQRSWIKIYPSPSGIPRNAPGGWGLAEGLDGLIWLGAYRNEGAYRFDPILENWGYSTSDGHWGGSGVCVAPNGNAWVAIGNGWPKNTVAKYDSDGNLLAIYKIHTIQCNPVGIGSDGAGNIIVVNEDSYCIDCLREPDGAKLWCLSTLPRPHVYSSFIGGGGDAKYRELGNWTVVQDTGMPEAYLKSASCDWVGTCNDPCTDCENCDQALPNMTGQCICAEYRCAETRQELDLKPWRRLVCSSISAPDPYDPYSQETRDPSRIGRFVQIRVWLKTTDDQQTPKFNDLTICWCVPPKANPSIRPYDDCKFVTPQTPLTVTFDASGSYDPNGVIVVYRWDVNGDGVWDYQGPSPTFAHTYTSPYKGQALLEVEDDEGCRDQAEAKMRVGGVRADANGPYIDCTFVTPQKPVTITFDGSKSETQIDPIVAYRWDVNGDGIWDSEGSSAAFTYEYKGPYNGTALLEVEDAYGCKDRAVADVRVGGVLADANGPYYYCANADPIVILFDGSKSQAQIGTIAKYRWDVDGDGKWDYEGPSATFQFSYSNPPPSKVLLEVEDNAGCKDQDEADLRPITVLADPNGPYEDCINVPITFDGSKSTSNPGVIVVYRWDVDDDGTWDYEGPMPTFDYTYPDPYHGYALLEVENDFGCTDQARARVDVDGPEADANGPYYDCTYVTPNTPVTVTFDGSKSTASAGRTIVAYRWDVDGDGAWDYDGTSSTFDVTYTTAYKGTALLEVEDDFGCKDTDTAEVRIGGVLADANGPYEDCINVAITFDGSGSKAQLGSIVKYRWDVNDDGVWDYEGSSPTFPFTYTGPYHGDALLEVEDEHGCKDQDRARVNVDGPNADANGPYYDCTYVTRSTPVTVTFDGSKSTASAGRTIAVYRWDVNGDGAWDYQGPSPTFAHKYESPYKGTALLEVEDNIGCKDTDTADVRIGGVLADANGPYEDCINVAITFDGSGSTAQLGSIVKYRWDVNGDGVWDYEGSSPTFPYTYTGPYHGDALLEVEDEYGCKDQDRARVDVDGPNADANGPYYGCLPVAILFDGSKSSASDGRKIVAYRWDLDLDGVWEYEGPLPTFQLLYTDPHTGWVLLEVEDDLGCKDQDQAYISVLPCDGDCWPIFQAYPAECPSGLGSQRGFLGDGDPTVTSVPGILCIDPGGDRWPNYVAAAKLGLDYTIRNISLTKSLPETGQCYDVFSSGRNYPGFAQVGNASIRRWWPLMYDPPATTWTLTINYATAAPVQLPGEPGPATSHTESVCWKIEVTFDSLRNYLDMLRGLAWGTCEVPLLSNNPFYAELVSILNDAEEADRQGDRVLATGLLIDFETRLMDACSTVCPPKAPKGYVGIVNTLENPACCKLLVDAEYLMRKILERPD